MALPLAVALEPRALVYDCMDELSAFRHAPRQLRQREAALLRQASVVLTGGPALYAAKRGLNPNVHCLPSDERLDLGLVDRLAVERPDWQIVMCGPVVKIDPQSLPQHANLHWLGMQAYERLPHLMAG